MLVNNCDQVVFLVPTLINILKMKWFGEAQDLAPFLVTKVRGINYSCIPGLAIGHVCRKRLLKPPSGCFLTEPLPVVWEGDLISLWDIQHVVALASFFDIVLAGCYKCFQVLATRYLLSNTACAFDLSTTYVIVYLQQGSSHIKRVEPLPAVKV